MARPPKPQDEQLTHRGNFRLTDAEGQQLESDAAAAGLTVSDYVRGLVVQAKPRFPKASPDRAALIKALGILGFVRSDINQILKDRWAYKFVAPERVESVFDRIEAIADHIHNQLENDR